MDTRADADKASRPLPFTLDAYVQAVRAVSNAQQPDGPPLAPASAEALRALRLNDEAWLRSVSDFGRWKLAAVGESHRMSAEATRRGVARLNGATWARTAYRAA